MIKFENLGIDIDKVLEMYPDSVYVGQAPLKTKVGFSDFAADIFYTSNPDTTKGHKNYFAVYRYLYQTVITDASHVTDLIFNVVELQDGTLIYPRFQHDFRSLGDIFVDGGSWIQQADGMWMMWGRVGYIQQSDIKSRFNVKIVDGKFIKL